jgi:hypothetical protein
VDPIEMLLRALVADPKFFSHGIPGGSSLAYPTAPGEHDRVWPALAVSCPRGHHLGDVNLSCNDAATTWFVHSSPETQTRPGIGSRPGSGDRRSGIVSLDKTVFVCRQCREKTPGVSVNYPVSGVRFLRLYADAVVDERGVLRFGPVDAATVLRSKKPMTK